MADDLHERTMLDLYGGTDECEECQQAAAGWKWDAHFIDKQGRYLHGTARVGFRECGAVSASAKDFRAKYVKFGTAQEFCSYLDKWRDYEFD